mgnify:CR=1 FL=1
MTIMQGSRERPDKAKVEHHNKGLGPIPTWSFSALQTFEQCPHRMYLKRVQKIQESQHEAAARGTKIHDLAENWVRGNAGDDLPKELSKLPSSFRELRDAYDDKRVELEGDWGFDIEWQKCGWTDDAVWARVKCDAVEFEDERSIRVIDYKTGKKFGNELKHNQQLMLYAVATFLRFPECRFVNAELWYLDEGKTTSKQYTLDMAMKFQPMWHERALRMTTCDDFRPSPSKSNCRWCHYRKSGDCGWAVDP